MALPTYDKSKRKKSFQQLPKGAYVVQIKGAKEIKNKTGTGSHIAIQFDIAEGEYKDFYLKQYQSNTSEDKKWNNDAIYRLGIPHEGSQAFIFDTWNTFFADLEDSNNGFVFNGDVKALKGKFIGGKFHIEQSEYKGNIYDHTRLRWTCVADDVRSGNPGNMPNDKLISSGSSSGGATQTDENGFMTIPDGGDDEIPFL